MLVRACHGLLLLSAVVFGGCAHAPHRAAAGDDAEQRAVAFLAREVPAWSRANGCFSCHNNGDAARALFTAKRSGFVVPRRSLADTTAWVSRPPRWDHNKGDPGFSDPRLANLQFASSLLAAIEAGIFSDRAALHPAALKVAADQGPDGAWRIEAQDALGSPATYGTALATFSAWRVLTEADALETKIAASRAADWLRRAPMSNGPAVAAVLWFSVLDPSAMSVSRRTTAFALLRRTQTTDGGWGPYADSPAEVFDTALALLALAELPRDAEVGAMIQRGRAFILTHQRADGGWTGTTRPAGGESYAQTMSTTGWATLALLRTATARSR